MTRRRRFAALAAAGLATLVAAGGGAPAAEANGSQLSLIHDDIAFRTDEGADRAKDLGADVIAATVYWDQIAPAPTSKFRPRFNAADSRTYPAGRWDALDDIVRNAHERGIRVYLTPTGPLPHWGSEDPRRCGSNTNCVYRPRIADFERFMQAVASRYSGTFVRAAGEPPLPRVAYWSVWNEPNLDVWLSPQFAGRGRGRTFEAARRYRDLYVAGRRAVRRVSRAPVFFGETATRAIPLRFYRAALCLDPRERACPRRPAPIQAEGIAIHPYNWGGHGRVLDPPLERHDLPVSVIPRLGFIMGQAERNGQLRRGAGLYITEYGFETNPPDIRGVHPNAQAGYINEGERLFWQEPRIRMTGQYQLADEARNDQHPFHISYLGIMFANGREKPGYGAWRMPIRVTRRNANSVEVWGNVRPAVGPATVTIEAQSGAGPFQAVRTARTNAQGYFAVVINRAGAAAPNTKWRTSWTRPPAAPGQPTPGFPVASTIHSRVTIAHGALRFRR